MWRTDSLEKILMLGKIEGGRRRGWQRMRWLDGITDSMGMSLSKLQGWWWTGRPGVLQSTGSQRIRHSWASELNWKQLWEQMFVLSSEYHLPSTWKPLSTSGVITSVYLIGLFPRLGGAAHTEPESSALGNATDPLGNHFTLTNAWHKVDMGNNKSLSPTRNEKTVLSPNTKSTRHAYSLKRSFQNEYCEWKQFVCMWRKDNQSDQISPLQ